MDGVQSPSGARCVTGRETRGSVGLMMTSVTRRNAVDDSALAIRVEGPNCPFFFGFF